ncbi:phosphate ABC transporter substrate-binding protein PstS family protein [Agromyces sp. NPDC057865]|uniref:PstS family phosphate ABC transporter substrate-binding protein n=1 Tax=Agromyces sp. NPDC057865 TaxID=3346267 RepID=UPI00366D0481
MRTASIAATGWVVIAAFALSACAGQPNSDSGEGGSSLRGTVVTDGSSTVGPLTKAAAIEFEGVQPDVQVTVQITGTGGGFESFCSGQTDISNASRPIGDDEKAKCADAGVDFSEIVVANDGISVAVNPENDWVDCITVEQLHKIWAPESQGAVTNWNQVDPSFPDEPLTLFGPGTASGTFDYFTDAINGEEGASRIDYAASEDDNVTIDGVKSEAGATGYFGLTYLEENTELVRGLEVDGGDGCVFPSVETVQDGTYTPLSRPLFIYVSNASYAEKDAVKAFVDYYVDNTISIAESALFVPLTDEQTRTAQDELASLED